MPALQGFVAAARAGFRIGSAFHKDISGAAGVRVGTAVRLALVSVLTMHRAGAFVFARAANSTGALARSAAAGLPIEARLAIRDLRAHPGGAFAAASDRPAGLALFRGNRHAFRFRGIARVARRAHPALSAAVLRNSADAVAAEFSDVATRLNPGGRVFAD